MNRLHDITEAYITHLGLKRIKGTGADPILPFFMLDVMNTIYRKDILALPCKFEAKRSLKEWARNYHALNADFFSAFSDEQQDRVIDIMDEFEAFIGNDIIIAKVAVMNVLANAGIDLDSQDVLASCMTAHILAQSAQVLWKAVYGNHENPYIKAIIHHAGRWMNLYSKGRTDMCINLNESKSIEDAVSALCRKMVKFLKNLEQ